MSTEAGPTRNGTAPREPGSPPSTPNGSAAGTTTPDEVTTPDDVTAASVPTAAETDRREASELGLREILREDFRRHYGSLAHPGLHVLAVYRLGQWRRTRRQPLRAAITVVYKVLNNIVVRNLYGVELSEQARLGRRVHIGHHQTILIPPFCEIGDDCTLRHNLTIGYAGGSASPRDVPKIGARVELAPGVHLLGAITIGDDARIGPGSIVMTDVPAGSTVFAAPARIMRPPTR